MQIILSATSLTCLVGLFGVGCQDSNSVDQVDAANASSFQSAEIIVGVDGEGNVLEPHPIYCGVTAGGQEFIIRGGLSDGDDDPGNNLLVLSISGQRRAGFEQFSFQYTSESGQGRTYEHSIIGPDAPFMSGNTFQWSGQTDDGTVLEVYAVCPVIQ